LKGKGQHISFSLHAGKKYPSPGHSSNHLAAFNLDYSTPISPLPFRKLLITTNHCLQNTNQSSTTTTSSIQATTCIILHSPHKNRYNDIRFNALHPLHLPRLPRHAPDNPVPLPRSQRPRCRRLTHHRRSLRRQDWGGGSEAAGTAGPGPGAAAWAEWEFGKECSH
jgi:hypothetical protein